MSTNGVFLLILSSLCTVAGNLLMRAGIHRAGGFALSMDKMRIQVFAMLYEPMFVTGFLLYGAAAVIWFRLLSTENLSVSYPLLVSLTFVLVTLGAVVFFHEPVSWRKLLGMSVILVGFILMLRAQ